ncbi:MAG: hypothetical protein QG567_1963 [Campylobacterota bacterium]|nr:hypothetical protein [Campylobacterota bacterium]
MSLKDEIKSYLDARYNDFMPLVQRTKELAKNSGNDYYIDVASTKFTSSAVFDDVIESKEKDIVFITPIFFAEIEDTKKSKNYLKKNFPAFYKLQDKINELIGDGIGAYVAVGKDAKVAQKSDNEIGWAFDTLSEFKKFAQKFDVLDSFYTKFLDEVEAFSKEQKFKEVSNSGVVDGYSNGSKTQEVLFKDNASLFKIMIRSESHEKQSYATLKVITKEGWSTLSSCNPKRDFGVDWSYKPTGYNDGGFDRIIDHFYKIAEKTQDVLSGIIDEKSKGLTSKELEDGVREFADSGKNLDRSL